MKATLFMFNAKERYAIVCLLKRKQWAHEKWGDSDIYTQAMAQREEWTSASAYEISPQTLKALERKGVVVGRGAKSANVQWRLRDDVEFVDPKCDGSGWLYDPDMDKQTLPCDGMGCH